MRFAQNRKKKKKEISPFLFDFENSLLRQISGTSCHASSPFTHLHSPSKTPPPSPPTFICAAAEVPRPLVGGGGEVERPRLPCGAREDMAEADQPPDGGIVRRDGGRSMGRASHGAGERWEIVRRDGGRDGGWPGALCRRKSLIVKKYL